MVFHIYTDLHKVLFPKAFRLALEPLQGDKGQVPVTHEAIN